VFIVEWLVLWYHFNLAQHPVLTAAGEPWVTFVYFAAAAALVVYRWRSRRLQEGLRRVAVEAESVRRLTQTAVGIADRAHTPLQSLEIGLELLARRHPDECAILERMRRSHQTLCELSQSVYTTNVGCVQAAQELGEQIERSHQEARVQPPSS